MSLKLGVLGTYYLAPSFSLGVVYKFHCVTCNGSYYGKLEGLESFIWGPSL